MPDTPRLTRKKCQPIRPAVAKSTTPPSVRLHGCLAGVLCGFPVDADGTGAVDDDVKKPAGHHQVLVEMNRVVLISERQMHAESRAQTDKDKQSSGPPGVEPE